LRAQSLAAFDWPVLSSPVKSSSRWERRHDEDVLPSSSMSVSASGGRLSDAVVALQLAAAQEELARLQAPAAAVLSPALSPHDLPQPPAQPQEQELRPGT
jgi:hypothetical protein